MRFKKLNVIKQLNLDEILNSDRKISKPRANSDFEPKKKHSLNTSNYKESNLSHIDKTQTNLNNKIRIQSAKPYQQAYKGYHFLSEMMKTKMKNFRKEIEENRLFSASKKNTFSLCYPPAYKLNKNKKKTDLKIVSMVCLEDYEEFRSSQMPYVNNSSKRGKILKSTYKY